VRFARAAKVVHLKKPAGKTFSYDELKKAIEENKPAALFLCQARHAFSGFFAATTVCGSGCLPMFASLTARTEWTHTACSPAQQPFRPCCVSSPRVWQA